MMRRKGLSGIVSAILITVVLVAGIASASYVNLTTKEYNEVQMQEALRQARLGSELIRVHVHSTDGSLEAPPRITFVNAWGFESRIRQLVVIARNMTVLATVNLTQPLVLPPGSRVTVDPAQIGLGYGTFRELADNVRSIHAYTEAGNSFGSTWGFPRDDNMAGRTVAVTYNATTMEAWNVPSVTWLNTSFTIFNYTTIGAIPPVQTATIKAVNHFERISVGVVVLDGYGWTFSSVADDPVVEGWPPAPTSFIAGFFADYSLGSWSGGAREWRGYGLASYWWKPENGFTSLEGPPVQVAEANAYVAIVNRPLRVLVTASHGSSYCTASYSLRRATITPNVLDQPPTEKTATRTGMIISFTHKTTQTQTCWGTGCGYVLSFPAAAGPVRTAFNRMTGYILWDGGVLGRAYGWDGAYLDAPIPTGVGITTVGRSVYSTAKTYYGQGWVHFPYYGISADGWPAFQGIVTQLTTNTFAANDLSAIYVRLPPGNYTVDRYYYVDDVQCNVYVPSGDGPSYTGSGGGSGGVDPRPPPPPPCRVYLVKDSEPVEGGEGFQVDLSYSFECRR